MTEREFRELAVYAAENPSVSQKLDIMIGLLTAIYGTTSATVSCWSKNYEPPKVADCMPAWVKTEAPKKRMTAAEIAAVWNAKARRG